MASSLEPRALADTINALLGDTTARARMRRNALAAAGGELRWDVEQQWLIAVHERLLGVPSARDLAGAALSGLSWRNDCNASNGPPNIHLQGWLLLLRYE